MLKSSRNNTSRKNTSRNNTSMISPPSSIPKKNKTKKRGWKYWFGLQVSPKSLNSDEYNNKLIVKQSRKITKTLMKKHVILFMNKNKNGSFEEFIENFHPDNAKRVNGQLLIDPRHYILDSDILKIWLNAKRKYALANYKN